MANGSSGLGEIGGIGNVTGGTFDADYGAVAVEQRVNDARDEQTRELINSNYEDDEFFYTENEQAFLETLENSRNEEIQYEYENVLNGNQCNFWNRD